MLSREQRGPNLKVSRKKAHLSVAEIVPGAEDEVQPEAPPRVRWRKYASAARSYWANTRRKTA